MQPAELRQFAQALCDPTRAPPAGLVTRHGVVLADRFAVYRNNVHVSLVDALSERHAVTRALVGEEFFHSMARAYVADCKPTTPVMLEYGQSFPAFIGGFAPAAELPYLMDVARLELAWSEAWAAAESTALSTAALADISAEALLAARVTAHPATRLLRSPCPIATLWDAHQGQAHQELAAPDLSALQWRAENVLITRPDAEIRLRQLSHGPAAFAQALLAQSSVESAAAVALAEAPDLDIGSTLGQLIADGMITELTTP